MGIWGLDWRQLGLLFLLALGVGLVLTLLLAIWVIERIRRVYVPPDADFLTTLRLTPFSVVLLLDLLDFTFDFLSAPISWTILGYLGLKSLRYVTTIEAIIPGTQVLPTMTIAWLVARLTDPRRKRLPG